MNDLDLVKKMKELFPYAEVSMENNRLVIRTIGLKDYIKIRIMWRYIIWKGKYIVWREECFVKRFLWKMRLSNWFYKLIKKPFCHRHGFSCNGTDYYYRQGKKINTKCRVKKIIL